MHIAGERGLDFPQSSYKFILLERCRLLTLFCHWQRKLSAFECGLLRLTARRYLIINDVAYGCGAFFGIKPLENPRVGSSILPLATNQRTKKE